eukprot:9261807-Pyramimonas_sp.AAC.1
MFYVGFLVARALGPHGATNGARHVSLWFPRPSGAVPAAWPILAIVLLRPEAGGGRARGSV